MTTLKNYFCRSEITKLFFFLDVKLKYENKSPAVILSLRMETLLLFAISCAHWYIKLWCRKTSHTYAKEVFVSYFFTGRIGER